MIIRKRRILSKYDRQRRLVKRITSVLMISVVTIFIAANIYHAKAADKISGGSAITLDPITSEDVARANGEIENPICTIPRSMLRTINQPMTKIMTDILIPDGSDALQNDEEGIYYQIVFSDDGYPAMASNAFAVSAVIFTVILGLIKIIHDIHEDKDLWTVISLDIGKTAISAVAVLYSDVLAKGLAAFGTVFSSQIISKLNVQSNDINEITLKTLCGVDNPSLASSMALIMILTFPWALSAIMNLFAKVTAYSLLIELGVRRALFPWKISNVMAEGLRSPGMRSVMKYLSSILRIMMFVIISNLVNSVNLYAMGTARDFAEQIALCLNYVVTVVALNAVAIGLSIRCGSILDEALGV